MPKRIIPCLDTTLDAQGASKSEEPTRNGLIAMTSVFVVTMVVNTMTTLTIILARSYLQTLAGPGGGEQPHQYSP